MYQDRTINDKVVGKCSLCGGLVVVPIVFLSVIPPVPKCINCGAIKDEAANLPTIPMTRHCYGKDYMPWNVGQKKEKYTCASLNKMRLTLCVSKNY